MSSLSYNFSILTILKTAVMVISGWKAAPFCFKVVWRCAMMEFGEQCVILYGAKPMQL